MYKLAFYVPPSHLELVKQSVFEAGAGKVGHYDSCCWQLKGEGQYRALTGAQPYLGVEGELTRVEEYRVELVCLDECVALAVEALRRAHPYEEPAYDVWKLEEFK